MENNLKRIPFASAMGVVNFKIGRIKAKTEKLEFNPLLGEETIPEWRYKKLFDKMLYKYQWI